MKNEDFLNILYPPQWVSKILHICVSGAMTQNNRGLKNELVYCVLPILVIDELREKLNRAKRTSTFFTIFEQKTVNQREYSIDFSKRIDAFSKITNDGLVYLGNIEPLDVDNYISTIFSRKFQKHGESEDSDFQKASYYLGILLAKEDYKNIFMKLGVFP
jgi:hypothetical protein